MIEKNRTIDVAVTAVCGAIAIFAAFQLFTKIDQVRTEGIEERQRIEEMEMDLARMEANQIQLMKNQEVINEYLEAILKVSIKSKVPAP